MPLPSMSPSARAAARRLKAADDAMLAYIARVGPDNATEESPEYQRLYAEIEAAYDSPDLSDRYRDPRDRGGRT